MPGIYLVLLSLWLCLRQGISQDTEQRFRLQITKVDPRNLILQRCRDQCIRRGSHELSCMCEDHYAEAAILRAQCGDGGRNETAVMILADENEPDRLNFCARAFARLGYSVKISSTNNSDGTYYTDDELKEKVSKATKHAREFWDLLDRTLVGVYLESDLQRNICKDAYDEWLCSVSLSLYLNDTVIRPCLRVCTRVVQQCPYYLPSKFQKNDNDDEIIYGGYPIFDCPEHDIVEKYEEMRRRTNQTLQAMPYSLEQNCIGRDGVRKTLASEILLLLSVFSLWWVL